MSEDLRSDGGASASVTHRFRNEREADVSVYWLDYEGKAVKYGTIGAGSSVDQPTYAGHAWRLCDEQSGACLVEYVGTSAVVTLQADGSVKVVAAPDSPVTAAHTAAEEPPLDMPPLE